MNVLGTANGLQGDGGEWVTVLEPGETNDHAAAPRDLVHRKAAVAPFFE